MGADQLWASDSQEKDSQCPNYSIENGAKLQQQKSKKEKKKAKKRKKQRQNLESKKKKLDDIL